MKKLIFRKLYFDIASFFGTSLVIVGLIVWTIQAVNYFDIVTEDGHGLKIYFYYSLLNFPRIIQRILPFIFFLSVFYTIIKYESKNEIFIFWVNGINKINFLNKLLIFSIICMFAQIILSSYFSPLSKNLARNYLKNSNIDLFTSLIKEGKFINITKGLTIFINKKNQNEIFENIFLEENKNSISRMIYAKNGSLIENNSKKALKLTNGRVINFDKSKINIFDFDEIVFKFDNLNSKTITVPKIQEIDTKILLSCFFEIPNKKNNKFDLFKCEKNLIKEVKIELLKRLYKPIYIPIIVLFSFYLLLFSKTEKNYTKKINFLFILVCVILVFSEVTIRYSAITLSYTIFYFLFPILIFIYGYFQFYKMASNV